MSPEPTGGVSRIHFKLRTAGLRWALRRLESETLLPTTAPGRALHLFARSGISLMASVPRWLNRRLQAGAAAMAAGSTLYAFYDLKVAPVTFDFLWFLAGADLQRRRDGLERVHVVIVPGPHQGFRREYDDYESVVDISARRSRLHNILVQSCQLLPSCSGLTLAGTREEAEVIRGFFSRQVYPRLYEPKLPNYSSPRECFRAAQHGETGIAALRAPEEALRTVRSWLGSRAAGQPVVSITLRSYNYMPGRNSNLQAWIAFADSVRRRQCFPIFIPDTSESMQCDYLESDRVAIFREAAWDVALRMALYESAYLNLGVNTGPMGLCWLNANTRYATFKMLVDGVPQTTETYLRSLGFEPGKSLPFAGPNQMLVWENDDLEVIERVFAELAQRIGPQGARAAPEA